MRSVLRRRRIIEGSQENGEFILTGNNCLSGHIGSVEDLGGASAREQAQDVLTIPSEGVRAARVPFMGEVIRAPVTIGFQAAYSGAMGRGLPKNPGSRVERFSLGRDQFGSGLLAHLALPEIPTVCGLFSASSSTVSLPLNVEIGFAVYVRICPDCYFIGASECR